MTQNELVPLEEGEVSGAMPHRCLGLFIGARISRSLKLPELMEMISDEEGLGFAAWPMFDSHLSSFGSK